MEVIRFDAENIIATSDGPGVNTHSWDSVTKLLTCPEGHADEAHYTITAFETALDGSGYAILSKYTNGKEPALDSYKVPASNFEDAAEDNWYVRGGKQSQYKYIKCNDGK